MKFNPSKKQILLSLFCLSSLNAVAQQTERQKLSVAQIFELAVANNPTLAVSKSEIEVASQDIEIAKNNRLPDISTALSAMYIGNAYAIEKDFSTSTRVYMPHFGNAFSVEATQLVWKGGAVNNTIKAKTLQEELASLGYLATEQNVKLLALGYYLDLYKLRNQADVFRKNIELAEQRYDNSNKFYKQGLVTRNDVIRGELQISNLKLDLLVIENNAQILNKQLTVALGLDESIEIIPDETILNKDILVASLEDYRHEIKNHPTVLMTQKGVDLFKISEAITRSDMMPTLAAFAVNSLQRPITTTSPALDMYANVWQVGLSLRFNISSLYKTPKEIRFNKLQAQNAEARANETEQMIGIAVKAAHIKHNEAITQSNTLATNKDLANENYRIMENKYNNQLAILLDLIDASNAKLDAELQYTNAEINIIFTYYKLLRESGQL